MFEGVLRIAHISDFHVARRPVRGEWTLKRLLAYGNFFLNRRFRHLEDRILKAVARVVQNPPHLIIITGDLIQTGLASELSAVEDILSPLTARGVPILVVEGNHDCYGGRLPSNWLDVKQRLAAGIRQDEHGIVRLPGLEVLLLDETVESPPFFSYGRVNERQLAGASAVWTERPASVVRLVCGHYPVATRKGTPLNFFRGLRKEAELVHFLCSRQVNAYLCGHRHKHYISDLGCGVTQYAASSLSTNGRMDLFECIDGEFEFIGEG